MKNIAERIAQADWQGITENMHQRGFAALPKLLTDQECDDLKANYSKSSGYRKTVAMERYRFGLGEYKYFDYPLPDFIDAIRTNIYVRLAPIANAWFKALRIDIQFPKTQQQLQLRCQAKEQDKATPLILKYGTGGFNTLHQDLYGDVYFPIQTVVLLSDPDKDFTGGEFVLIQQVPRAQSKANVVKLHKGDALIFTTNFKPEKGGNGYYRVNMKHGVSEVHSGERYALGVIFHDALT